MTRSDFGIKAFEDLGLVRFLMNFLCDEFRRLIHESVVGGDR